MIYRVEAETEEADVVVIGGGPAGSTAATLIAQRGYRVCLFEREHFPRFHIGESLIPETYWVLERLNMLPKMRASKFVHKHSVQFVTAGGRQSAPFYFHDNKPHACSQAWQVVRSEFDLMMLNNAREHGVNAREGVRVRDVIREDGRAVGVKIQEEDGTVRDVRARVVVDASGQSGLLMNKFNLRIWDPVLNKGAVWTYWEGAYRDMGRDEGATVILQVENRNGWFWYIPLHDNSSGVLLALRSGEMAADAIVEGLRTNDVGADQLGKWWPTLNQGIDRMRRLVCEYYEGFSFGGFVRENPHLLGRITDLLIGDLFTDKVDEVWGPKEKLYRQGRKVPNSWDADTPAEVVATKHNELILPDGIKP